MTGLLTTPALGACHVALRPYQDEAIAAAKDEFRKGRRSTLLVLPTGVGKTVVAGMIIRRVIEKGGRALFLAHRDELIEQAADKFDMLGIEAAIEQAERFARSLYEPACVVATVQTLQRRRLASWAKDYFDLLITDEAHHSSSTTYQRIYEHFVARHLGVTATPDRADGTEIVGTVFESLAYEMSLRDAILAPEPGPYLCRLTFTYCDVDIDLTDIRTTGGDFNQADLEAKIRPLIDTLANAIRQEIGDRKTIVFTPDIGSAQAMATALASLGLKAEWVSGDDKDRKLKVERLHSGDIRVLCNCAILTEGFDCPTVSAIVLCRPTKSRPFLAQMVGRGTRLAKDKVDCLVVDFNYLTQEHDIINPVELFDTSGTDSETLKLAVEMSRAKKGADLLDVVEQAREEAGRRQVLRVKARERDVKYKRVSYDPVSACDAVGVPWRGSKDAVVNRATEGQVKYLQNLGVEDAPNLSRSRASTLIDYLADRRKRGLATLKQVSWAIAKGIDAAAARELTFADASALLDKLFRKN